MNYKNRPFNIRITESSKIREKYPSRVPVIVEKSRNADIPDINKQRYLVPKAFSFGQFIYIIRRQLELPPDKALFLFINNVFVNASESMDIVYNNYRDIDGFLYITYSGESVFG